MARGRTFVRTGKKIDFKQWDGIPGLIAEVTGTSTTLAGALSFTTPATLLRFRGYVGAMFDETMQAGDQMDLVFGLAIISTDAFNAGPGGVPDPASEPEFPWIWWKGMRLDAFSASAQNAYGSTNQRYEMDSKAMRKIKPGETVVMVTQVAGAIGAPVTLLDIGQIRVLIGT